jgi:anthranilate phosphoribosyltransferase
VAKHGNRSASGNSGSAEVLTELGVRIDADPSNLIRCLGEVGITFLYAPQFHPALRHVGTIRRQLPFRTLFNLVGPLANPARPDYQLIGVPDRARTYLLAMALSELRASPEDSGLRAFVIAGANGLDEVSLSGTNFVECVGGPMARLNHVWAPAHFQLPQVANHKLAVTGPVESARKIRSMLSGEPGPIRNVILANAAAALFLCEKAAGLVEGVALATQAVDRGDAARLLERWATLSHQ